MRLYIFIIIAVLILITLILLLFLKINIVIEYNRKRNKDHFVVYVLPFKGFILYKYKTSQKENSEKKASADYSGIIESIEKAISSFKKGRGVVKRVLEYLKCRAAIRKLNLVIEFGTGNASHTGILTGIAWTILGIMLTYIDNYIEINEKNINIKPNFVEKKFNIDLYCIFRVRIVHIIIIVLMIRRYLTKPKTVSNNVKGSLAG
ncbi:MAG TPA: DUF2953 domain-containing protein [Acetivibrio sp.]|nr:DUF2953 domain-containing protein [Clostridium sp.]HOQ38088.1 DUF2953 domain-containing protein [Acetivibrio sp.]HPT91171.1 DUF2953 domain-containing protein [Acetivibrio sp.]HQA58671.1 DUF2953 domain-containing protein [Acetivibrio sp.]